MAKDTEPTFGDWSPDDFEVVRLWVYTAEHPNLTVENFCNVWKIADYLLIESLKEACLEFIKTRDLDLEQALRVLSLLEPSFADSAVLNGCTRYE